MRFELLFAQGQWTRPSVSTPGCWSCAAPAASYEGGELLLSITHIEAAGQSIRPDPGSSHHPMKHITTIWHNDMNHF